MAYPKRLTARGIKSLSTGHKDGQLRISSTIEEGPAGTPGRHLELMLDQGSLDWLLSHLAQRPQFQGLFRLIADELAAMEAVRNDPSASVIERMNAQPGDLGAHRRLQRAITAARAAQEEKEGQEGQ